MNYSELNQWIRENSIEVDGLLLIFPYGAGREVVRYKELNGSWLITSIFPSRDFYQIKTSFIRQIQKIDLKSALQVINHKKKASGEIVNNAK